MAQPPDSSPSSRRRQASISLTLDNRWSLLKMHGDPDWKWLPTYLPAVVPRIVEFLCARRIAATFFITGQDAAMSEHKDLLRSIAAEGHEIGNHSFNNEPALYRSSQSELAVEVVHAEEQIEETTGRRPYGFRGPGARPSQPLLRVLVDRGYLYDSSCNPTFAGPIARRRFFHGTHLSRAEKDALGQAFGEWKDALSPVRPFLWQIGGRHLLEIPATAMPGLRAPIQLGTILGLSQRSSTVALAYFRMALELCSLSGIEPCFCLTPLDFLSQDDAPDLHFLTGLHQAASAKMSMAERVFSMLEARYDLVRLEDQARSLKIRSDLLRVEPEFQTL